MHVLGVSARGIWRVRCQSRGCTWCQCSWHHLVHSMLVPGVCLVLKFAESPWCLVRVVLVLRVCLVSLLVVSGAFGASPEERVRLVSVLVVSCAFDANPRMRSMRYVLLCPYFEYQGHVPHAVRYVVTCFLCMWHYITERMYDLSGNGQE